MRSLSSVVWSEGMHLAPHHFQAQSRYFEDAQHFVLSTLFPHGHGLVGIELDDEALRNGTVSLVHARGIMPDGLPFHFPHDPLPDPLQIGELFSPTARSHRVLLGIPPFRSTGANCRVGSGGNGSDPRFTAGAVPVVDAVTGQDEKPVALARKAFRLLLAEEDEAGSDGANGDGDAEDDAHPSDAAGDLVTLPIARIERDGAGNFVYDPAFVPPSLHVGASRALVQLLGRILEVLESRSQTLAAERAGGRGAGRGHGSGELVSFWFTHAVNSNLALLRHHLANGSLHPERLFADLSMLAGALGTFSLDADVARLPVYDHDDPGPGFAMLEREIRAHLGTVVPTNVVDLPVEPRDEYVHTVSVSDGRTMEASAHWYLGIRSSARRDEVIRNVPQRVKICSAKHIDRLVREAYPGLDLDHTPTPPAGLSPTPGMEYFRVGRTEPCWRSITETAAVGIYVPDSLPDVELELVAVMK